MLYHVRRLRILCSPLWLLETHLVWMTHWNLPVYVFRRQKRANFTPLVGLFLTEILRSTRKHFLAMVDPDAPSKKKSSKAQWLHWIVTNVEGRKVNNPVGWIAFVFHSFQPTPFLLGLVLSIGTSGSTEVGDHYRCFILRSPTSSLLRYHLIIRPEIIQQWAYTRCSWDIVCRLRMGMRCWCTQAPHHQKGEENVESFIYLFLR